MSALSLLFVFAVIVPSALSLTVKQNEPILKVPPHNSYQLPPSPPSPPPVVPCDQQYGDTLYGQNVLQCSENPQYPGVWVHTNLDPLDCQGYCDYTILTTPTPPTPSPPNCGLIFENAKLTCAKLSMKGTSCIFEVFDAVNCVGSCVCKRRLSVSEAVKYEV